MPTTYNKRQWPMRPDGVLLFECVFCAESRAMRLIKKVKLTTVDDEPVWSAKCAVCGHTAEYNMDKVKP